MKECSKSIYRRLADPKFMRSYFVGNGVDIGGKPDPLALYRELFPLMADVKTWDWEDGDAQYLSGVSDSCYDFVHSSHCLEHLNDPLEGISNWFRVVRESGYLVITVPEEDLYEQGVFPSTFNGDHKWTFTIYKESSWSDKSINVLDLVKLLGPAAEPVKIEKISETYRNLPRYDQTLTPIAESAIEFIIRKRTKDEVVNGGNFSVDQPQPSREIRIHLNQYMDDMSNMKSSNSNKAPFTNDSEI